MQPKLYTKEEALERFHAAGLTDLTLTWLDGQMQRGMLAFTIVARKRRVRSDSVERMIDGWLKEAA